MTTTNHCQDPPLIYSALVSLHPKNQRLAGQGCDGTFWTHGTCPQIVQRMATSPQERWSRAHCQQGPPPCHAVSRLASELLMSGDVRVGRPLPPAWSVPLRRSPVRPFRLQPGVHHAEKTTEKISKRQGKGVTSHSRNNQASAS